MKKTSILLGIAALASSGFGIAYARERAPAPEVRAIGAAKNCVSTHQIRSTKVIDNRTIDFKMVGGKTYRNALAYSCPGLRREDAFSYRTSTSQLCNVDIIRVVENYGGRLQSGAGCGLGKFQQIEKLTPAS